jgi:hypothetical protein
LQIHGSEEDADDNTGMKNWSPVARGDGIDELQRIVQVTKHAQWEVANLIRVEGLG